MATPILCCGFECGIFDGSLAAPSQPHWTTGVGSPSFSTTTVRSGSRSLRINTSASTSFAITPVITGLGLRWVGRFYLRFATLPTVDNLICGASSGGGPRIGFETSTSRIMTFVNTFGASGVVVTTGVWYRIDFDFTFNTTGNDTCAVQVDGVACGTATGTGVSTTPPFELFLGCSIAATSDMFFDDLIISATGADYPLGAGYIHAFEPSSDGIHNVAGANQWERGNTGVDINNSTFDAYDLISNVPLPSGAVDETSCIRAIAPANATDYVECTFGPVGSGTTPTVAPRAVQVISAVHSFGAGGSLQCQLNDNGTTDTYLNSSAITSAYGYGSKQYADPPSAASAWTVTAGNGDFNNLRHRVLSADATPNQCLDAVIVEAEFPGDFVAGGQPFRRRMGGVPHMGPGRGIGNAWR